MANWVRYKPALPFTWSEDAIAAAYCFHAFLVARDRRASRVRERARILRAKARREKRKATQIVMVSGSVEVGTVTEGGRGSAAAPTNASAPSPSAAVLPADATLTCQDRV